MYNSKGVNYIEKNGLERVTSIDVLLLMQRSVWINFTVLQPHFPHAGPTHPVGLSFTLGSYGVHDFAKELVSPLY
jgi:hypothetical protein